MRIISGKAKGRKLKSLEGLNTRPTTDRLKETLFNIIAMDILDCKFLDICAGSGGIGLEAFSRNAKNVTFIENNGDAINVIKENIRLCNGTENTIVIKKDCIEAIKDLSVGGKKYDIIFIDPPYNKKLYIELVGEIVEKNILEEDGYIIVERLSSDNSNWLSEIKINKFKEKVYKTTTFEFLSRG